MGFIASMSLALNLTFGSLAQRLYTSHPLVGQNCALPQRQPQAHNRLLLRRRRASGDTLAEPEYISSRAIFIVKCGLISPAATNSLWFRTGTVASGRLTLRLHAPSGRLLPLRSGVEPGSLIFPSLFDQAFSGRIPALLRLNSRHRPTGILS